MKKKLLFSLSLAAASFNCAADWQDASNLAPEAPPSELVAAAAAAAAPGAAPTEPGPVPTASPDVVPSAPVSAPDEYIKSVTPAEPPARAPKTTSIVLHDATLRSRPTSKGTGDRIAAETRVRMESSVVNGEGTWWFVTATGIGGGWMLESELGDPQR